ncbi:MAG: heavy metal-binding domain-containing protein [Methanobacteriaceae archaeon]
MINLPSFKENKKDILIATVCIGSGIIVGVFVLILFIYFKIAILGFNLGLIFSPLAAGYVETQVAKRVYKKTTGAISALLIFVLTVLYGFGVISEIEFTLNIFTIGGLAVVFQATFPIFVNYLIFVVLIGIIAYMLSLMKSMILKVYMIYITFIERLLGKRYSERIDNFNKNISSKLYSNIKSDIEFDENIGKININELDTKLLTVTHPLNQGISDYLGLFEGKVIIKNTNNLIKATKKENDDLLLDKLKRAREQALFNLNEEAKKYGSDYVIDVDIEFSSVPNFKSNDIHIIATGTGVKLDNTSISKNNNNNNNNGNNSNNSNTNNNIENTDDNNTNNIDNTNNTNNNNNNNNTVSAGD